jgi:transcription elongation GreA/GreB family factor
MPATFSSSLAGLADSLEHPIEKRRGKSHGHTLIAKNRSVCCILALNSQAHSTTPPHCVKVISMITRASAISAICLKVAAELEALESLASDARDEATSAETKTEGKYDTRATEASYLARGQAWRIVELRRLLAWLEFLEPNPDLGASVVQVGALVEISGARQELIFLAPIGGGKAEVDGHTVRVISPASPLGKAMTELEVGDAFEIESPRGTLEYEISAIG